MQKQLDMFGFPEYVDYTGTKITVIEQDAELVTFVRDNVTMQKVRNIFKMMCSDYTKDLNAVGLMR